MGFFDVFGSGTTANGVVEKKNEKSNAGCGCLCLLAHIIIIPLCFLGSKYWYDYQHEQQIKRENQSLLFNRVNNIITDKNEEHLNRPDIIWDGIDSREKIIGDEQGI